MADFAMKDGNASGVHAALCRRFCEPSYSIFFEVHDKTGWKNRSADAIAMGLWKSRGLDLHGFEIKNYRADWLRELKDPAKAEDISRFCDYWWLAVGDQSVAKLDEIPSTWGFMVLKGKSLHVVKSAPKLDAEPITRPFLAALLRRGQESVMEDERVRAAIERATEESRKRAEDNAKAEVLSAQRERDHFKASIEEFEKASGIKLNKYDAGYLGEAVQFLRSMSKSVRERESLLGRIAAVRQFLEGHLLELSRGEEALLKAFAACETSATSAVTPQEHLPSRR